MKSVVAAFAAIALFACEGNYQNIQRLNLADNAPIAEGREVEMKYTDSGAVMSIMKTPRVLDFSNYEYAYREFPKGVSVVFWDEGKKNTVTSKYGIIYDDANLVDLRDSVVIVTSDSVVLRSDQLYWDQDNNWIFTDKPYEITFKDGSSNEGDVGFDSSQDFTTFISRQNESVQIIEKKDTTDGK
jgi:LPS export ABC transporter protein LptC